MIVAWRERSGSFFGTGSASTASWASAGTDAIRTAGQVQLYYLTNAKSGLCPEDCGYCSQSAVSESEIPKYRFRSAEEAGVARLLEPREVQQRFA